MKDDEFSNPSQTPDSGPQDALPVDALGIPILSEVVALGPGEALAADSEPGPETNPEPQDYEILLAVVREHLKSQLEDDLGRITRQVVTTVIANATRNLESEIERELNRLLDEKLSALIDESLDQHLGSSNMPPR